MRHQWKGGKTCHRCGCYKKTTVRLLLRPVFGNRKGKTVTYIQNGTRFFNLPPCQANGETQ